MHIYHIYYVYTFIYILLIPLYIYIYIYIFDIYYCLTVTGTVLLDKSERTK